MGKPEDIAAEKAVFAFEARIQGGEFEGLDPNGSEARDALKSEIRRAILSAVEEEREECALEALRWQDGIDAAEHIRRRNRKGA